MSVLSEATGGGDRVWLERLGQVRGLTWTHTAPGGPATAQLLLGCDPGTRHRAWQTGRRVTITRGPWSVWYGTVDKAVPQADGWQLDLLGIGGRIRQWRSISLITANALAVAETVSRAINDGLPVVQGTLPTFSGAAKPNGSVTLGDALDTVCVTTGQTWTVDPASHTLSQVPWPTTPTLLARPRSLPPGRQLDGFADVVYAGFIDPTTSAYAIRGTVDTDSVAAYGRVESYYDVTSNGTVTTAQADTLTQSQVTLLGRRPGISDPITVGQGDLTTLAGAPVDVCTLTAPLMVRLAGVHPDSLGDPRVLGGIWDLLISQVDIDVESETASLHPRQQQRGDAFASLSGQTTGA